MQRKVSKRVQKKKGGAFLGEGAFGCVFDSTDIPHTTLKDFVNTSLIVSLPNDKGEICAKVFFDAASLKEEVDSIRKIAELSLGNVLPEYIGYAEVPVTITGEKNACKLNKNEVNPVGAIYMQKLDFTLMDVLSKQQNMTTPQIEMSLTTLIKELDKLHRNNLVHCDIKPQNIMYSKSTFQFYLVDFGMVQHLVPLPQTFGGTPFFASPVIFMHNAKDAHKGLKAYRDMVEHFPVLQMLTNRFDDVIRKRTNGGTFYDYLQELKAQYEDKESHDIYKHIDMYSMALVVQLLAHSNMIAKDNADNMTSQLIDVRLNGTSLFEKITEKQNALRQLDYTASYGIPQQYVASTKYIDVNNLPFPM